MKTMEKFAGWFVDHDKRIMAAHINKEKSILKRELRTLEEERYTMRDHYHRLEALIEKQEGLEDAGAKTSKGGA